jgi:uncharacterized protein (DUF2141 family)
MISKTLSTFALGLLTPLCLAAELTVHISNVASEKGTVMAMLCDKENFLKSCEYKSSAKAQAGTVVLTFNKVAAGKYAISAFHDENDNKKLDRNLIGVPKEGYGFSNNAQGRRGPPSFEEAALDIKDGHNETNMALNY